jgi:tRNA pseudouridine38-40 synthase
MRLKLTVAYDGRPFQGWQSQRGGQTVQDLLAAALAAVAGTAVPVTGAGRTDAGVHALGQVAHADVPETRLTPARWLAAVNAHLPREIRVLRCGRVGPAFHARFAARGKEYRYRIWNHLVQLPLELGRSWHVVAPLDLGLLREQARQLVGRHDFAAFAANRGRPEKNTVRTLERVTVRRQGPLVTLVFEGDGFLYKMVRLLTGALVQGALHRAAEGWWEDLLAARTRCAFAAPAHGLYLARVRY